MEKKKEQPKGLDFNHFVTDEKKEEEGVWFDYGNSGLRLLIARVGNDKSQRMSAKLMLPYLEKLRDTKKDDLDPKVLKKITIQMMAKTILLGWEGLLVDEELVPYSVEKAEKFLKMRDFYKIVDNFAGNVENYRQNVQEESAKN